MYPPVFRLIVFFGRTFTSFKHGSTPPSSGAFVQFLTCLLRHPLFASSLFCCWWCHSHDPPACSSRLPLSSSRLFVGLSCWSPSVVRPPAFGSHCRRAHFGCDSMSSSSLFKVAASTHTITPWRDWQEWKACKDGLIGTPTHHGVNTPTGVDSSADGPDVCGDFAEEKKRVRSRRRRALHTVNVWRARGRVPLAVDSTAQLIELNLQHEEDGPPAQSAGVAATPASAHFAASNQETTAHHANTTLQSRLQYSIALLRLVNGVLDPMQAKQHAQSVLTLAKQMQMPRLLVDLRHESTHQGLPSLPLLRHASHVALDWLSRHYWSAQSHAISKVDEAIRHQLKAYKQGADAERQKRDERKRRKKQEDEEGEDGQAKDDMTVAINSGDAIMFDAAPVAAEKAAMPEKSQEALKALFTTITSGHSLQHAQTVVETKLLPMLLSEQFLIKPPKQRSVLVSPLSTFH